MGILENLPAEYIELKNKFIAGWKTWNVYSVLSHVRMKEGLALNIAIKEYRSGKYLKNALIGRQATAKNGYGEENVEVIKPGLHAYDHSYTEVTVVWEGMEFSVESTVVNEDILLLVTPKKLQKKASMIVLETGYLWDCEGHIYSEEEYLVAYGNKENFIIRTTGKLKSDDCNIPTQNKYISCYFSEPVAFYTGKKRCTDEIRMILNVSKEKLLHSFKKYKGYADIYEAIQCAISWDTTYDAKKKRVATPVSRLWSIASGGFVMFCWDNYFAAYMSSLECKELAYANIIEITRERTKNGFVPNCAHSFGYSSEDRSQPPVGSNMLLKIFNRYKESWIIEYLYPYLREWNNWFWNNRRNKEFGGFSWGSNPFKAKNDNYWEYIGVNDTFGGALESGLDNSPMYDGIPFDKDMHVMKLIDVGLTGLYIYDCQGLKEIAAILGKTEDFLMFEERMKSTQEGLEKLWNEEVGCYCNFRTDTKEFSARLSPTNFYALFDMTIPPERVNRMIKEHYYNKKEFYGEWIMPSIARNDPDYKEQNYWCGRIWAPMNFLVYLAMGGREYLDGVKTDLANRSTKLMMKEWRENRHIHENYNADTGEGCDVKNSDKFYHWGALLGIIGLIQAGLVE